MAGFFELIAFQTERGRHDGDCGDGVTVFVQHCSSHTVDAFEPLGDVGGEASFASFRQINLHGNARGERGRRVLLELHVCKEGIKLGGWQISEDGLAWGAGIHRHLKANGAAHFDWLRRDALLQHGHLVIHAGEELRGFARFIAQPFQRLQSADDEAFLADLRAGEIEELVGKYKALVVLAALEIATIMERAGDAEDGVHGQIQFSRDLGETQAGAMLAEEFQDRERALGAWCQGIFRWGDDDFFEHSKFRNVSGFGILACVSILV